MRGRFMARVGCGFMLFVGTLLAAIIVLWLFGYGQNGALAHPLYILAARWILTGLVIAGVAAALGVGLLLRRAALPFGSLLEAAGRVAAGDFSARVPEKGPGEVRALAAAFNGMTERLRINAEQRQRLLADVSHELRTPLTVIQGNLEGMLDGVYPPDAAHIEPLLEETRVMARVIEDLRTLSMAEGGGLRLERQALDPARLLHDAAAAHQARASAAGVDLRVEAAHDLPAAELDPIRMREILDNLLANALRHTPAGGAVRLSCRVSGERLEFCVSDSGPGIPAEDLPRVFDRYHKGAGSPGMGLGLAIARRLVEAHGGEIHAESEPGQGALIRFTIPPVEQEQI